MKKHPTYRFPFRASLFVAFIGLLLANSLSYYYWLLESEKEPLGLVDMEDSESEKEEKKSKEDQDEKIRHGLFIPTVISYSTSKDISLSVAFQSLHYLEVHTPPPEPVLFIS